MISENETEDENVLQHIYEFIDAPHVIKNLN